MHERPTVAIFRLWKTLVSIAGRPILLKLLFFTRKIEYYCVTNEDGRAVPAAQTDSGYASK